MRREDGTHEPSAAARSQKRRADGTHEPDLAARSQKRRADGTHEPDLAARPQSRRADGTHEPKIAARPQKRREGGTHENAGARDMRRQPPPLPGSEEGDKEIELRMLCYGSGVAYIPAGKWESNTICEKRHERVRLLVRRTGREPDWRDKCPLEERAIAVGVMLKDPANGRDAANTRANRTKRAI